MNGIAHRLSGALEMMFRTPLTFRPPERIFSRLGGGFLLAYHNIPADRFVEQIESYHGLRLIALSEMISRISCQRTTSGCLAITVDDGVGSTVQSLARVALDRGWPITFFLPTKYLDEPVSQVHMLWTNISRRLPLGILHLASGVHDLSDSESHASFLSAMKRRLYTMPLSEYESEVRELREKLVAAGTATPEELDPPPPVTWQEVASYSKSDLLDFQSHGVTHAAVGALSTADLEDELKLSQRLIADATGKPCRHFCYPFGGPESIGPAAPKHVSRYYDSAVTMTRGRVRGSDPMLLPRIPIYDKDSPSLARLKVLTI
jgi:peptidoglycan/xylan/chitin deacetylase (PgdA/CDA1 family)